MLVGSLPLHLLEQMWLDDILDKLETVVPAGLGPPISQDTSDNRYGSTGVALDQCRCPDKWSN